MRLARISTRTRILAVIAALAAAGNLALFLRPAKADPAELHARLWSMAIRSAPGPGTSPRELPYLDSQGAWRQRDDREAKLSDTTERAGPDNIDGPPYLVSVSLGRDGSYGNFLRTLRALARDRACIVAVADSDRVPAEKQLRFAPVLEIAPAPEYSGCPSPF